MVRLPRRVGFVLVPIVTLLLSAWLDDEPLSWGLGLGGLLVLAGVYVGALRAVASPPDSMNMKGGHRGHTEAVRSPPLS